MMNNYITNEQEFKNYMLGVEQDLREEINSTPMTTDEDTIANIYAVHLYKNGDLICNACRGHAG